jgi:hypothetical protein
MDARLYYIGEVSKLCGGEIVNCRRKDWRHFICPYCGDEKGRFGVNSFTLWVHCFHCGHSGSVTGVLKDHKVSYQKFNLSKIVLQTVDSVKTKMPEKIAGFVSWYDKEAKKADIELGKKYFCDRGIDYKVPEWGVDIGGLNPLSIIFPIRKHGKVVSYQVRRLFEGAKPKVYSASPDLGWEKTSELLYNFDMQPIGGTLVINEGIADAIKTGGVGIFGSGVLSKSQLYQLSEINPQEVIVMFDSDAFKKSLSIADQISRGTFAKVKVFEYTKEEQENQCDPCDITDLHDRVKGCRFAANVKNQREKV